MDAERDLQQYNDETIFTVNNINISGSDLVEALKDGFNERKPYLMRIFQDAIDTKQYGILNYLFLNDVKIEPLEDGSQKTIFHLLYYADAFDKIKEYPRCDTANNYRDENGLSLLHIACMLGNIEVVEGFLASGFDVNQLFNDPENKCPDFTPLHFAAMYARGTIVNLLLYFGANINNRDGFGRQPLHLVCRMTHTYCQMMVDTFADIGEGVRAENVSATVLDLCMSRLESVRNPEMEVLNILTDRGSDVNAIDGTKKTPMFYLFNSDPCWILKSSGIFIFPNAVTHAMIKKLRRSQRDKLEFLLRKGANARVMNNVMETPLYLAVSELSYVRNPSVLKMLDFDDRINIEMIEMLLEARAEPRVKNKWGETPLELAVIMLSKDIVDVLLLPSRGEAPKVVLDFYDELVQKHPNMYPCLEAVDNLLRIVEAITAAGVRLDTEDQVEIMMFMAMTELNYEDKGESDENLYFKVTNAMAYGTWSDIARICNNVSDETYDRLTVHIIKTLHFLELANFYVNPVMRNGIQTMLAEPIHVQPHVSDNCHKEISDLQSISFDTGRTLYEYMGMHPSELEPCITDCNYRTVVLKDDCFTFSMKYYYYGQFVKAHFTKAIIRRHILRRANLLGEVVLQWMRDNMKKIYHYFTESDLRGLDIKMPPIEALNEI